MSTYRLRYDPDTALGHKYASIRYPRPSLPGIPTRERAEQALAAMPNGADMSLAERCVMAGCKPGGVVLDPFSGSGTTGAMANKHGRKYVGIDLSADYLDLSLRTRFAQPGLDFDGEATA